MPKVLLEHDWARTYAEYRGVQVVASNDELLLAVSDIFAEPAKLSEALQEIPSIA